MDFDENFNFENINCESIKLLNLYSDPENENDPEIKKILESFQKFLQNDSFKRLTREENLLYG